jgi:hypothetical protein
MVPRTAMYDVRDYVDTDRGVMKVSDVTTIEEDDPPASASY